MPFLPALVLALAILLSRPWWPDSRLVLAEASLWNPLLLQLTGDAIFLALAAGVLMTVLSRRCLAWPWLLLTALLMVHLRPPVPIVERLLGSALELVILLALVVGEHLLRSWTINMQPRPRQSVLLATALLLVLLAFGPVLLPDNPQWQSGMLSLAALLICGNALLAAPLALANRLAERFRRAVPQLRGIRLPQPWLPAFSVLLHRRAGSRVEPPVEVPQRPMLSLDEGYLVRHDTEPSLERQRRTG
ncbi:MAG: hypothetical protein H7A35_09125 [Planctomycetales bacterium]|nr:hypothetical protein [bacterium]UNM07040.1 MAG: hypothetical protein H7A35_09125 [Planctomycetales bacterium]